MEIILRELQLKDLEDYLKWKHPSREFRKYNGPYYQQDTEEDLKKEVDNYREQLEKGKENVMGDKKIIADKKTDEIIGEVNWCWKSEETLWMELGVIIFNENYWGKGLGYEALKLWVDEKFKELPNIVRLGLTTWSGNERMMKLAEKLGFKKEAVYRKARILENKYYDSVSYGILREEWEELKEK